MTHTANGRWLILHSSDEMYGSDRVLLETVRVIGSANILECWLPTDVNYPEHLLCQSLESQNIPTKHLNYPILRRSYMNPTGIAQIASSYLHSIRFVNQAISSGASSVYLATSATLPLAPIFKARGLRVVAHVHESWNRVERCLFAPLLVSVDTTIAVSSDVANRIPGRVTVIYNGFPDVKTEPIPQQLHPSGVLRFLVASRWSAWKGHDDLLHAWSMLKRKNVSLTILGSPPPSGKSINVLELIEKLNLRNVYVIGQTQDVDRYIQTSDVVLVPSSKPDPLPTIAIEAARSGRPVIASRLGGLPEIVKDGVTGWLVSPRNISEWASTIDSISIQQIKIRGANARVRYLEQFSENRFHNDLRAALDISTPR